MRVDCLQHKDLSEKKRCIARKIERLHHDTTAFHQEIRDAVEEAQRAVIDLNFIQIRSVLKSLIDTSKFSMGTFFCDLILSILAGPVLGTVAGKFFAGPIMGIDGVRRGLDDFSESLGTTRSRTAMSDETAEALAGIGVSKLALERARSQPLPGFPRHEPLITDVSTGVIVDAFQLLHDKLVHVVPGGASVTPTSRSRATFSSATLEHDPTPLEYVTRKANEYLSMQKEINDLTRFALEVILALLKKDRWLTELQSVLDHALDLIGEFQRSEAKREVTNTTKMMLIIMYFGSPTNWATDKERMRLGKGYLESEIKEEVGKGYASSGKIIYPIRFNVTKEIKEAFLNNLMVPGKGVSYLRYYRKHKESVLGRTSGLGIDKKRGHSPMELKPQGVHVGDPDSEWYTVEETAFRKLQDDAYLLFAAMTDANSNSYFKRILIQRGALRAP